MESDVDKKSTLENSRSKCCNKGGTTTLLVHSRRRKLDAVNGENSLVLNDVARQLPALGLVAVLCD
jgi:hypothetical protein